MRLFLLMTVFITTSLMAQELVGFKVGNNLESVDLHGDIYVRCFEDSRMSSAYYTCRKNKLFPGAFSKFIYKDKINADEVKLQAIWESGKVVKKKSKFENGESTKRFNLWVLTLLQRPLLAEGKNIVYYSLLKDGAVIKKGLFEVMVNIGNPRTCAYGSYYSGNSLDCESSFSMCNHNFRRQNNCK